MRYTPLKKIGPSGRRQNRIKHQVWRVILARARYVCESCGQRKPLEWAHIFGRPGSGFCLGAIANSRELTAALCRDCHNALDRHTDPLIQNRLWATALVRLIEATVGYDAVLPTSDGVSRSWDVRSIVRAVEEAGWSFNEQECRLEKAA